MRRTTDLLDVFRDRGAGRSGKPEEAAAPKAPKKPFDGLFLLPRQLLLGSSVVVLLLVFAFVLGLSMGRRSGSGSGQALQANAPRADDPEANVRRVYVLGRVPVTSATGLAANEPVKLRDVLSSDRFGVDPERIWIAADRNDAQQWILILGPFATEKQATDYLSSHRLTTARLGGSHAPFQRPVYRNWLPSELPRTRLPGAR
jgi:hypothetical protein